MAFIHPLNDTIFILTRELAVIHCLRNSFSSRYRNYFLEYSQAPFFQQYCPSFWCQNLQRSYLTSALTFSAFRNSGHRQTNLLSKRLYFQSSIDYNEMRDFRRDIFFRIPICVDQLLPSYKYFLVTILFLISYFLKINTFSAQLQFRRNFLRGRYFLKNVTFSDSSV